MKNRIQELVELYKIGEPVALPSYCTGNKRVIEAILSYYKDTQDYVLLEATSNQVNQFGGYTGRKPADYKNMVFSLAEKVGMDAKRILLGGDHLGPLIWCNEPEKEAMSNAVELVKMFVAAGYQKIHLDTSMKLGDDPADQPLSRDKVAQRGALLFKACEETFAELRRRQPDAVHPVYIIGSEVPIPGGASGEEIEDARVTKVEDLMATIQAYEREFQKQGINDAFDHIMGIVVQPGVEYDNDSVVEFDPDKAKNLAAAIRTQQYMVFEGHSTDYQTPEKLKEMAQNGVFVLKVGPALTLAYREALRGMENILHALQGYQGLTTKLLEAMDVDNHNWLTHYHKSHPLVVYQKYSFSDRCRYYLDVRGVNQEIGHLKELFDGTDIPLFLVHQYLPLQYYKLRNHEIPLSFDAIVNDMVGLVLDNYRYAAGADIQHKFYV